MFRGMGLGFGVLRGVTRGNLIELKVGVGEECWMLDVGRLGLSDRSISQPYFYPPMREEG